MEKKQIEKAARIYKTDRYAAEALGITPQSFSRLCKRLGIESPNQRRKRNREQQACR